MNPGTGEIIGLVTKVKKRLTRKTRHKDNILTEPEERGQKITKMGILNLEEIESAIKCRNINKAGGPWTMKTIHNLFLSILHEDQIPPKSSKV